MLPKDIHEQTKMTTRGLRERLQRQGGGHASLSGSRQLNFTSAISFLIAWPKNAKNSLAYYQHNMVDFEQQANIYTPALKHANHRGCPITTPYVGPLITSRTWLPEAKPTIAYSK